MAHPIDLINKKKGKPYREWPGNYSYKFDKVTKVLTVELLNYKRKNDLKGIDVWALAARSFLEKSSIQVKEIKLIICMGNSFNPEIEALRRRVSFLSINNHINLSIQLNSKELTLYSISEIFNRGPHEIIRTQYKKRDSGGKSSGLEKILQNYLFDTGTIHTNERLAIFGEDFYKIKDKKFGIEREFPTGAYRKKISEKTRVLPTEFIDFVTINKYNQLAVIELKLNDSQLEVISQSLNYFLFIASYFNQLKPIILNKLNIKSIKDNFKGYIVTNRLHERFSSIKKYYKVNNPDIPFEIVPTILGAYL